MLYIRRIVGESMHPTLLPGTVIIALRAKRLVRPGRVVVLKHNGIEKIKRLSKKLGQELFLEGDNKLGSTDSRQFGWLPTSHVIGVAVWPLSVWRRPQQQ